MKIICGDSLVKLRDLPTATVDACVCDAPYGLKFMQKRWDYDVPSADLWREVLRVLKPGAHLLCFGGTRTYHRMVQNIEDAGFEVRDMLSWLYGSGFPKSQNVAIQIDKQAGAMGHRGKAFVTAGQDGREDLVGTRGVAIGGHEPITDDAKQWQGWGTALKPACEPIVLARKPLSEKIVAANVLRWGVGAINVDAGRIGTEQMGGQTIKQSYGSDSHFGGGEKRNKQVTATVATGRWPANVLFDEEAAALLDEQSGVSKSQVRKISATEDTTIKNQVYGKGYIRQPGGFGDSGGASRFFYVAKASKSERSKGLDKHTMFKVETGECKDANTAAVQLLQKVISESTVKWLIGESGANITVIFPKECKSTIATEISKTIELKTLSLLIHSLTNESTQDASSETANGSSHAVIVAKLKAWLLNTTNGATELALGASRAASKTLQSINESAEPKDFSNFHSTVKPIKLMEYLCKLICPPNGIILDPFMGSGSTGVAAKRLGFEFIGIEREEEYCAIARRRIEHAIAEREKASAQLDMEA